MNAENVLFDVAGLLKSGMPAARARAAVADKLAALKAVQLNQLEAIWSLSAKNGGSISQAMSSLGESFHGAAKQAREIELAFAAPKATAKLVSLLPAACLALAQAFGLNPIGAVFRNRLALLSVLIGIALLVAGRIWTKSIIAKAAPDEADPGLVFDAVRTGLMAGLPLSKAIEEVALAFGQNSLGALDRASLERLEVLGDLNRNSGASLDSLLISAARSSRELKFFAEADSVAKLSVKLMLPLGLVTLPAFVLTSVVPIAIGLLSDGQN
jgi:tight adherence protein B